MMAALGVDTSCPPGFLRRMLERVAARLAGCLALLRPLVPRAVLSRFDALLFNMRVLGLPDRIYLEHALLPALAATGPKHVLFVGTAWFTARYGCVFSATGATYHTLDRCNAAAGGAPEHHHVTDLRHVAKVFPHGYFDVVIVNGVFGFGLDTQEEMMAAARAVRDVMRDGGLLLLGWNPDRVADPLGLPGLGAEFRPTAIANLPARAQIASFDDHVHVFDLLKARRREEGAGRP